MAAALDGLTRLRRRRAWSALPAWSTPARRGTMIDPLRADARPVRHPRRRRRHRPAEGRRAAAHPARRRCCPRAAAARLYWPWIRGRRPGTRRPAGARSTVPPSGHVAGIMARSDSTGRRAQGARRTSRSAARSTCAYPLNDTEQGAAQPRGDQRDPACSPVGRRWCGAPAPLTRRHRLALRQRPPPGRPTSRTRCCRACAGRCSSRTTRRCGRASTGRSPSSSPGSGRRARCSGAPPRRRSTCRIDEELNPPSVRDLGQVVIEIGVAPVRPAEFVVVRIGLWDGGAQITEG